MSKKSRKRNKLLLAGAALFGASKLGMLGSKPVGSSNVVGKTPEFRKSFVKPKVDTGSKFITKKTKNKFPLKSVNYKGEVIKKGVNTGVGNEKTKFVNLSPDKGKVGIYQGGKKVSDLNQKAINVLSDGKIQTGNKTFSGKKEYRKFKDAERLKKRTTSMSKSKNKKNPGLFGFTFDKPLFNKGTMVKARGGGMARSKPTKLY
jgi:hypothetical protein